MSTDTEQLYAQRLRRYVTALQNGKPDCVPIRPFVAEFVAKYGGYTCQQVTHDFQMAFDATRKCASAFDWDATVSNMVYVWTGLTQAIGLKYYGVPGIDVPPDTGFQYLEPPENDAFMQADDYDELIDDPTAFLFKTWLPRVSRDVCPRGAPVTHRNNMSFLKGGMAMLNYFTAFGTQNALLKSECATVPAIAGIFKAPLDILADKLRGYLGLTADLIERPEKVYAACEALMPHLLHVALSGADVDKNVPIGFWLHRGCVPFISYDQFDRYYWATLKPIIQEIWRNGHQVLFYAEGKWDAHLTRFAELPEGSIVFHIDRSDPVQVQETLGHKFCISGGIPNYLLTYGTPDEVRACCKKLIDTCGRDGGFIMDASAIIQNDAQIENMRAMTEFTREYGVYNGPSDSIQTPTSVSAAVNAIPQGRVKPGVCIPWEEKLKEIPKITGDPALLHRVWEDVDALGYLYIWHCLLSF